MSEGSETRTAAARRRQSPVFLVVEVNPAGHPCRRRLAQDGLGLGEVQQHPALGHSSAVIAAIGARTTSRRRSPSGFRNT